MGYRRLFALVIAATALLGCRQNGIVALENSPPLAKAQVLDADGAVVDMAMFTLEGETVEVTLVADGSSDVDGEVTDYRWITATPFVNDAGPRPGSRITPVIPGSLPPMNEPRHWPGDSKRSTVTLPEGEWSFSLWVIDDEGAVSTPDVVTVVVAPP